MAEEAKKQDAAAGGGDKERPSPKKLKPTNCAQTNKRIRRKDWYYRNGKYFSNKQAYLLFAQAEAEKRIKAREAQAAAASPAAEKTAE